MSCRKKQKTASVTGLTGLKTDHMPVNSIPVCTQGGVKNKDGSVTGWRQQENSVAAAPKKSACGKTGCEIAGRTHCFHRYAENTF